MRTTPTTLSAFLIAAKKATYAAQGDAASVNPPLLADTRQLEFRQGPWFYRDVYAGMHHFVGQELVYHQDLAVWSMSYSGGLIGAQTESAAAPVYAFLRQALCLPEPALPLRGPAALDQEGLHYQCLITGDLDRFQGIERISRDGAPLYELHLSGGRLS